MEENMKVILLNFLFILLCDNLISLDLKTILEKKISIEDGIYGIEYIKSILEEVSGLEVKLIKERQIIYSLENFKNKPIKMLLNRGIEIKLVFKEGKYYIELFTPNPSIKKEEQNQEFISFKFKDVPLKDIVPYLSKFTNMEFIFLDKQKENIKINCDIVDTTWESFLEAIAEKYNFRYEIKGNKVEIK